MTTRHNPNYYQNLEKSHNVRPPTKEKNNAIFHNITRSIKVAKDNSPSQLGYMVLCQQVPSVRCPEHALWIVRQDVSSLAPCQLLHGFASIQKHLVVLVHQLREGPKKHFLIRSSASMTMSSGMYTWLSLISHKFPLQLIIFVLTASNL